MRTTYRHKLKTNEVANVIEQTVDWVTTNSQRLVAGIGLAALVGVAVGGYMFVQGRNQSAVGALVSEANLILSAPIEPPPPPGQPSTPGSYPTEQAKLEAALERFLAAAEGYSTTSAGLAARYQAAGVLALLGRPDEAIQRFDEVIELAGEGNVYAEMARLGRISAQAQASRYDEAIAALQELTGSTDGDVPADAMLMQLGRVYLMAGRTAEAQETFQRLLDEYPQSQFVPDAQREFDTLSLRGEA